MLFFKKLLTLEELEGTLGIPIILHGKEVNACRKVFHFKPNFEVIDDFGFHIQRITNNIMERDLYGSGQRSFKFNGQEIRSRIGEQLHQFNGFHMVLRKDVMILTPRKMGYEKY